MALTREKGFDRPKGPFGILNEYGSGEHDFFLIGSSKRGSASYWSF